jgi:hypothetical protein
MSVWAPGACSPAGSLDAGISRDSGQGIVIDQNIYYRSTPFFAACDIDSIDYLAVNLSGNSSVHMVSFEKIEMEPGARISLYLGPTRYIPETGAYWMGDYPADRDPGPSMQHDYQIFVQRDLDSTYAVGYKAAGVLTWVHTGIPDFEKITLHMSNGGGRTLYSGAVWKDADAATADYFIQTDQLSLPPFPANLFAGFGFDLIPALQNACETKKVKIRWTGYSYFTNDPTLTLADYFECNTILQR